MFGLDAPELIVIAVVVVLLFGAKRLPDAARSMGRSMRIFRSEVRGMSEDEKAAKAKEISGPPPPPAAGEAGQTGVPDETPR
jgi:sec-independent protein translocase protein TatA